MLNPKEIKGNYSPEQESKIIFLIYRCLILFLVMSEIEEEDDEEDKE